MKKINVLNHCKLMIKDKIDMLNHELNEVQDSYESEDKNSSGDKFETGLAMLHQQKEKLMVQLSEFLEMRNALDQIDPNNQTEIAKFGSLVILPEAVFFIAVHIGKIKVDKDEIFVVSTQSPVGKSLLNKKINDSILFKGKSEIIKAIY